MKRKQRDTLGRAAMKLLCTLLGLVLAVMLAVTAGFQYLLSQIHYVDAGLEKDPEVLSAFSQISFQKLSDSSALTEDHSIVNILLIGQDSREGEAGARSDTMILCTIDKNKNTITMTSFLRDLYVSIPGFRDNRINAAYSMGGMALLKQTIAENFSVDIDGCIEVDFQHFAQIIDLLGGVELTLRQDEADTINRETGSDLTEGSHVLTGAQALTYSRIRSLDLDGDFSRTDRQRKVIGALVGAYRKAKLSTLIPLVGEILPMLTTDLASGQILLLTLEMAPKLSDAQIVSQCIPAEGTYRDETIDGMSVLVADMDAARQLLAKTVTPN